MNINCFRFSETGFLERVMTETVTARQSDDTSEYWMDIEMGDSEGLSGLFGLLGIQPMILDECIDQGSRLIVSFETGLRIRVVTSSESEDDDNRYMSIVCISRTLLTIRNHPVPSLDELVRRLMTHVQLHTPTTAALLHYILGTIFEDHMFNALEIRNRVTQLEDTLHDHIDVVELGELVLLKKQVGRLNSTFQDQSFVLAWLQQIESSAFTIKDQRKYYRDLAREMQQAIHGAESLSSRLRDIHEHCQLAAQEKTNRRLSTLTVIQAVFVPLTLIAGVYGMNFQYMPELQWSYGYWSILSLMGLIVITEIWVFWRGGWFE